MRFFSMPGMIMSGLLVFTNLQLPAQVPVKEEPRHHPVFQNEYVRILDVIIPPLDTTMFHIHATPSLFLIFNSRDVSSQVKGKEWIRDYSVAGKTWYRTFINDTLVHRVSNQDSLPFHATDIELIQTFGTTTTSRAKLPYKVLFDNEKAIAYSVSKRQDNIEIPGNHGPMIAALVAGEHASFMKENSAQSSEITEGQFIYLLPGEPYKFSLQGRGEINMLLFEVK